MSRHHDGIAFPRSILPKIKEDFYNALIYFLKDKSEQKDAITAYIVEIVSSFPELANQPISEGSFLPLHFAVNHQNVSLARLLISHGAKIDAVDEQGNTALNFALAKGIQVAKFLELDEARKIELLGSSEVEDLTHLMSPQKAEKISRIIKAIPEGMARDAEKISELIAELVSSRANISIHNYEGVSPLSVALENPTFRVSSIIIEHFSEAREVPTFGGAGDSAYAGAIDANLAAAIAAIDAAHDQVPAAASVIPAAGGPAPLDRAALEAQIAYCFENGREEEAFDLIGKLESGDHA